MKYYELTKEEQQIIDDFESNAFIVEKLSKIEKKRYQEYASATLQKTKNINIRLSEKDLYKVKAKAAENGMPYQTLVSSLIHRFINS